MDKTQPEYMFPSDTFEWKLVRIRRAAQPPAGIRAKRGRWRGRVARDPHQWIGIRVKQGTGSEGWVIVDARGEVNPIPGYTQLWDLLGMVNGTLR